MPSQFLMAYPQHYTVRYVINPWMLHQIGQVNATRAQQQWETLYRCLQSYAHINCIPQASHLPDMVFTANAGLALGKRVLLSQFKMTERQDETPLFAEWFTAHGYQVHTLPHGITFEGAGDALFDITSTPQSPNRLWFGYGIRSDVAALSHLSAFVGAEMEVIALRLVNKRYYHLDTCFCPLKNNHVLYYPPAFDAESLRKIEAQIPKEKRIVVDDADAEQLSCNAIALDPPQRTSQSILIGNHFSEKLIARLSTVGYQTHACSVTEFIKAGGSTKCLVLDI